jgi:tripartite-type tricarboxylate transporter receptor subunit TctC
MNLPRRRFLHLAAAAVAAPAAARRAVAAAWPSRPVRLIVGFTPAGGNDIIARLMGQWLTERLGQTFVIENRPGAGTNIAAELVINSPPDGYTLFVTNLSNAINATLYEKLNFDFMRDMLPVAGIAQAPAVLTINSGLPVRTVSEFIAHAKANPGRINMGSAGIGSTGHLAGELFKMMAGVNMVHIPYRGDAPALADLLGGQVQVMFGTITSSIEYIKAGKLRALAVTSASRAGVLPDTPSVGDFVPMYEASGFNGLGAPKNTPTQILNRLNQEINAALADPVIKAKLADMGLSRMGGSPADFGSFIAAETEKWGKVVKFSGAKAE